MTARTLSFLGIATLLALLPGGHLAAQEFGPCGPRLPTDRTTLELRGADVATTLRLMAERYRLNLLVTSDVTSLVTVSLYDLPVRDAFEAILHSSRLVCTARDGVLLVTSQDRLRLEEEAGRKVARDAEDVRAKADQARVREEADTRQKVLAARKLELELHELEARGPLREDTIRLSYADAEEIAKTLQGILGIPPEGLVPPIPPAGIFAPPPPVNIPSEGEAIYPPAGGPRAQPGIPATDVLAKGLTVRAHKPTNSVFIRHYAADVERIRRLVKEQLDIPLPQVQIVAQMVIVNRNALEQLGVQWGGAFVERNSSRSVLVGRGVAQPLDTRTGVPSAPATGTGAIQRSPNPNFNPGGGFLPVDPGTGLPTGGNVVNLPTAFLPTLANPALGLLFGIVAQNFNINLAIQALEVQGKARTVSEPKTVTIENAKAVVSRGFEIPYVSQTGFGGTQVQFRDALVKLEVTPKVIREDDVTRIRMKILVENNEPDFTRSVLGVPPIFKRRAENEVIVREGERLVIGGVIVENDLSTVREVPALGRIPILGWLFKSRELSSDSSEMVIIVTPSVVTPGRRS